LTGIFPVDRNLKKKSGSGWRRRIKIFI